MDIYLYTCIIMLAAGLLAGLTGFGSILISLPLMTLYLDVRAAIPLATLTALTQNLYLFGQLRRHFDRRKVSPLLIGAVPGIVLGVMLLKRVDPTVIYWILGLTLCVYGGWGSAVKAPRWRLGRPWGYAFGFLAGCLGGAMAGHGPPVVVYTSLQNWSRHQIKVTMQSYFIIAGSLTIVFHAVSGLTTGMVLGLWTVAMPANLLGAFWGSRLYARIGDRQYRRAVMLVLVALGVFMLARIHS